MSVIRQFAERCSQLIRPSSSMLASTATGFHVPAEVTVGKAQPTSFPPAGPSSSQSALQALGDVLGALWNAVPKRKTTPSRRGMRMNAATKVMKPKRNIHVCPRCGDIKQSHVYCKTKDCGRAPEHVDIQ